MSANESLHYSMSVTKGEHFVHFGEPNNQIGQVEKGVLRGYVLNEEGIETTTHFFMEGDLISGNYTPDAPATINIQALEDCLISAANYKVVFSKVNKDSELTEVIVSNFQKLNKQNASRIESLVAGDSLTKYGWFLNEYPNLLNRIPHYHIANFLGMTPTQLSRVRRSFSQHM